MITHFDIAGTHIPISSIKDFRIIEVEFIFRPVFQEVRKSMKSMISGKKFEFIAMQPFAAIMGQQGHKSALGEYKPKDFKEALGKDISNAAIYTIADKLKLKAFKHQKYQCLNLAGRAFSTYLDDVPVMITWNDGRIAEVYKEDPLYKVLGEITTPGIQYIPTLVIQSTDTMFFYGNGVRIPDASQAYEQLKQIMESYSLQHASIRIEPASKHLMLPQFPKLSFKAKHISDKETSNTESESNTETP